MNKKVLKVAFVAAIAMVSGINVFNAQKSNALSDIALANLEALATEEFDVEDLDAACMWYESKTCYYYIVKPSGEITQWQHSNFTNRIY